MGRKSEPLKITVVTPLNAERAMDAYARMVFARDGLSLGRVFSEAEAKHDGAVVKQNLKRNREVICGGRVENRLH